MKSGFTWMNGKTLDFDSIQIMRDLTSRQMGFKRKEK
jgi:hypothetical protein